MASGNREVIWYVSAPWRFACSCFAEMARGNLSRNFFMAGDKPASSLSNALVMSFRNAVPAKHSISTRLKYSAASSGSVRPVRARGPSAAASTRQNLAPWTISSYTGNPAT
jgi:hypothetical protein